MRFAPSLYYTLKVSIGLEYTVNLRTRIMIIFGVFLTLEIFFFYGLYKWDLSPKIYRLEKAIVERALSRNMELLQRELFHLEQTGWLISSLPTIKNAVKNDLSSESPDLMQAIMLQQDLNLLYIIDDNNRVIFGKIIDLDSMTPYPNEKFLPTLWKQKPQFIKASSTSNSQIGIYTSIFGPILMVSIPIGSNQNTSNIIGRLLIGKLLTAEMIQLLRKITFSTLSVWPLEGATLSKRHLEILKMIQATDSNLLVRTNNNVIQSYVSLADLNQKNPLLLSVTHPRELHNLITVNLLRAIIIFISLQLFFIAIVYFLIGKRVNTPLNTLIEALDRSHNNVFSMTFSNRFWGDLGPLIESLSAFIRETEQRTTKKNMMAYQQGFYFADQSLLEDVKKTLIPLLDGLTHLESQWLSLPTDQLEWVLAECKNRKSQAAGGPLEKDFMLELTEICEKLNKLQKNSYQYTLKLHREALRSSLLLRRHASHLSPPTDLASNAKAD